MNFNFNSINKIKNYNKSLKYLNVIKKCIDYNYYDDNNTILKSTLDLNIYVFGGFIRYLISNNEEFQDLDIYLGNMEKSINSYSEIGFNMLINYIVKCLYELPEITKVNIYKYDYKKFLLREKYGVIKLEIIENDEIFNIDISISLNNNMENIFNFSCDYTVNNLYMQFINNPKPDYGILKIRQKDQLKNNDEINLLIDYTNDIEAKKLKCIIDYDKIAMYMVRDYNYYYFINDDDYNKKLIEKIINKYCKVMEKRYNKMLNKGYSGDKLICENLYEILNTKITKLLNEKKRFY